MLTLARVVGSLVALAGFASSASAHATVDLLWFTNGFQTSAAAQSTTANTVVSSVSETLTVGIYITNTNTQDPCPNPGALAGPCRLSIVAFSVDASDLLGR